MSTHLLPATRLSPAVLRWLLDLRPGPAATLAATVLAVPDAVETLSSGELVTAGAALERDGELLPAGEAAVVGDVLTSAAALVRVGTADAVAALVAVGRDRVLVLTPDGHGGQVAGALAADVGVGAAVASIAEQVGEDAVVLVAVPGADIVSLPPDDDLADRVTSRLDGLHP
ncbi:hypothetical protein C8046_03555 [Serinibacter arcticus]|uniref:Uncharacterized protein n=1 Tax=Serinibacter arcticus TaxID=1655435 RepID=A0A2U1ZSD2_9MICO|nr:hypothetical protein [Serinibacter arcticus]PWD49895.1 hypothetical protein C8046_03555 [Serinibacter arcticus]